MGVDTNEINAKSIGGTELTIKEFVGRIPADLLEHFQIIPSRVRRIDDTKIRIYWAHDLPGDPECDHLKSGGYNKFEKIVFVSNWQMQAFINYYGIPWRKCVMLPNAIEPITPAKIADGKTRIIYHTTPHRGLQLLVPAFVELAKTNKDVILDVFSSFRIYGWPERDEPYKALFDACREHPQINYHGTAATHDVVRKAVAEADIFAYPSIWMETGCRALMEAMSAGCLCIHPNYGCLYETAAQWTWQYQYNENPQDHARMFYQHLVEGVAAVRDEQQQLRCASQKWYADIFYNWDSRAIQWQMLLEEIYLSVKRKPYAPSAKPAAD